MRELPAFQESETKEAPHNSKYTEFEATMEMYGFATGSTETSAVPSPLYRGTTDKSAREQSTTYRVDIQEQYGQGRHSGGLWTSSTAAGHGQSAGDQVVYMCGSRDMLVANITASVIYYYHQIV
ncbi:hypothetical protein Bbelb_052650 [Branchiostoma belcheri]|nr:hypothetical protein Bbelb_052650 [Branchiostoma belcheri]